MDKIKEFIELFKDAYKELRSDKWYRQIPNILTASRLIAPIIILILSILGNITSCIIALILFSLTDLLDGIIARKFNLKSNFGALLDTIADKVFCITLMIPLIVNYPFYSINILLEVIIGIINTRSYLLNKDVKSILSGKFKMWILFGSIILGYSCIYLNLTNLIPFISVFILGVVQSKVIVDYNNIYKDDDVFTLKDDKEFDKVNYTYDNNFTNEKELDRPKVKKLKR